METISVSMDDYEKELENLKKLKDIEIKELKEKMQEIEKYYNKNRSAFGKKTGVTTAMLSTMHNSMDNLIKMFEQLVEESYTSFSNAKLNYENVDENTTKNMDNIVQ